MLHCSWQRSEREGERERWREGGREGGSERERERERERSTQPNRIRVGDEDVIIDDSMLAEQRVRNVL